MPVAAAMPIVPVRVRSQLAAMVTIVPKQSFVMTVLETPAAVVMLRAVLQARARPAVMVSLARSLKLAMMAF